MPAPRPVIYASGDSLNWQTVRDLGHTSGTYVVTLFAVKLSLMISLTIKIGDPGR